MGSNQVSYNGRKVVVVGAASGMGESVTRMLGELGAEIYALDIKGVNNPVKEYIPMNLNDKESIEAAVAKLPERLDHIFCCAGIAGTRYMGKDFSTVDVVTINYIGTRYFVESVISRLREGSSILLTSSIAAMNWRTRVQDYKEFLEIADYKEAQEYVANDKEKFLEGARETNRPYGFAKECLNIYSALRSWELAEKKIRINTVSPGATLTPMHDDFLEIVGRPRGGPMKTSPVGYESHPDQQASFMLALNSDMADYVSGQDVPVDFGLGIGVLLGRLEDRAIKQK